MSQEPDKQLLEKIEALQNVMLASITGGARDDEAYKQIRDELFAVPPLKRALPRFVRTCSDLTQLWHYIKSQENLPSYASRRQYIWDAFRPLLAGAGDEEAVEHEAFFVKGSNHDAYVHIRAILQLAKAELFIIDPYMDGSIYQVLGTLTPATMVVQILTSKVPTDFALEGQKFVKQHPGFTLRLRKTKDFHDRFVIVDRSTCYLLGASIKDAGNKGFTIVPLEEPAIIQLISNHADQVWTSAAPL
jgi:hypothetical protein